MKTKINVPSRDQVNLEAQILFDRIKQRAGKVPNLYATIGYSANALEGFLNFEEALNKGAFTPKEREAIALVVSEVNGCKYCLAAHTALAIKRGYSKEETLLIRKGIAKDMKLNTMIQLAKSIAENKGEADPILVTCFFGEGYTVSALIELTGLVAVRVFTNYVYALTDIPVDFPVADPLN
ncbi:carboxymuconolactone decarboxylase family protein [Mucilaginibacter glaciei]|uniref:Carboxymuconolactone decarboxylase family protein n=1 Tax=Mucilaginibacter glaciei TaxID=2772109 RepID=A0A926S2F4_9SPHI|nr:carboxymuconolactone decarboxylase family protein [Mucilaginibacter glaciei]MBD1395065.1 carboxymuconolactone decarboxylase family protein [Mucilaginibacter glaciei]